MMTITASHDAVLTIGTFALILTIYNVGDQFPKTTKTDQ